VPDYCCQMMASNVESECDQHPDRFDCPDALVHYTAKWDSFGLIVHDGGRSVIRMQFCPWCGAKLRDLSDEYFKTLEEMGLEEADDLPAAFQSDLWWKQRNM
jgi:hypothetical protein